MLYNILGTDQVMRCYWTACGEDYQVIGYKHPDGSKKVSTTKDVSAHNLCSEKYYGNKPNQDCCDAFGFNPYAEGCWKGWSDLWCYPTK